MMLVSAISPIQNKMATRGGNNRGMGSRSTSTDEMLETENNRMVDDLAAKVSRLKGVGARTKFSKYGELKFHPPSLNESLVLAPKVFKVVNGAPHGSVSELLLQIAIDIENESKQQNKYLDGMGDEFGSSSGLLSGSAARLSQMISSGRSNRKVMCYLIAGLVGFFFIGYYALSKVIVR